MLKVGFLGDRTTLLPFQALGMECYFAEDEGKIKEILESLKLDEYGLLVFTEEVREIVALFFKERKVSFPLLLPLPSLKERESKQKKIISAAIRRATGRID